MMILLNPTTLQQQLDIYSLKRDAEKFLHLNPDMSYVDNFMALINTYAPDISQSVANDIVNKAGCFDINTQAGLNSYLRMFYLSLPFDTVHIREYILETEYTVWVHYFVNILLLSYIEYFRGYHI